MEVFSKFNHVITSINKWMAYVALVSMMIMTGIAAFSRGIGYPIIGDVEFIQIGMVLVIVGSLAFTEKTNSHIAIGIIVDHFPIKVQKILDVVAYTFTSIFSLTVAYAFLIRLDPNETSMLLEVSFYPLKILLIIGFTAWGLVAIEKLIYTIKNFNKSAVGEG